MPFASAKDAGDFTMFNIHHGFPEGIVRGFRSGFLTDNVSCTRFSIVSRSEGPDVPSFVVGI